jgi:hypothetical protein
VMDARPAVPDASDSSVCHGVVHLELVHVCPDKGEIEVS